MPRMGRRRSLTLAATALAVLAAPAAAQAATYTIKAGDGPCGGADLACGGAVSKLSKVAVVTGAANAPALYVSGGGGLELSDAVVVSRDGFGIFITSGAGNKIVRTGVATGGQATGAIQVQTGPDDPGAVDVTVESSVLTGGGAGIRAFTRNNEAEALAGRRAGDITLTLRHITAA